MCGMEEMLFIMKGLRTLGESGVQVKSYETDLVMCYLATIRAGFICSYIINEF